GGCSARGCRGAFVGTLRDRLELAPQFVEIDRSHARRPGQCQRCREHAKQFLFHRLPPFGTGSHWIFCAASVPSAAKRFASPADTASDSAFAICLASNFAAFSSSASSPRTPVVDTT